LGINFGIVFEVKISFVDFKVSWINTEQIETIIFKSIFTTFKVVFFEATVTVAKNGYEPMKPYHYNEINLETNCRIVE
jgi:hypothetical protein